MRKTAIGIIVIVAALVFAPMSFAQTSESPGSTIDAGAWTMGVPGPLHTAITGNEAIVVESGKVKKVEDMAGTKSALQMRFVTDQGQSYTVYMGPKWFMNNQKLKFEAGDKVEVRGKKVGGSIIATEISKGDWTMKLRNEEDGVPTWECCFPREVKKLE